MVNMRKWLGIAIAALSTVPGLTLRLGLYHVSPAAEAIIYGVAIVGAAFMLSWAAEVFQLDVSQGLALAMLALIAILPEYIVDATFAWKAAQDPTQASLAVANMTGANRILIGVAWPLVVLLYFLRTRRTAVELQPSHGLELVVLLAATVYAFIIPVKGTLSWVDFVVLVSLFLVYLWRLAKLPSEEPHLIGPAQTIAALGTRRRRILSGGPVTLRGHPPAGSAPLALGRWPDLRTLRRAVCLPRSADSALGRLRHPECCDTRLHTRWRLPHPRSFSRLPTSTYQSQVVGKAPELTTQRRNL
jgi:hypothetical protein